MSWTQPLTRRVIGGYTGEMLWQVNLYLNSVGQIEYADLIISDEGDSATVRNVITQKTNRIVEALDELHIDPAIKSQMIQDIFQGISGYGINPYVNERVLGS